MNWKIFFIVLFLLFGGIHSASAASISDAFVADDSSYVYVADAGASVLYVVEKTASGNGLKQTVALSGVPGNVVVYDDYVLVAIKTAKKIDVISRSSHELIGSIVTPSYPYYLAVDPSDHYLVASESKSDIYPYQPFVVELNPNAILTSVAMQPTWPNPGNARNPFFQGNEHLLLDTAGDILFISNRGTTPENIHRVDFKDRTAPVATHYVMGLGANGSQFALSSDRSKLFISAGGAEGYRLQVIAASDLKKVQDLPMGAYPGAVSADALFIYGGQQSAEKVHVYRQSDLTTVSTLGVPNPETLIRHGFTSNYFVTNESVYAVESAGSQLRRLYSFVGKPLGLIQEQTASPAPDLSPLTISSVQMVYLSDRDARISWKVDRAADCYLIYGTTADLYSANVPAGEIKITTPGGAGQYVDVKGLLVSKTYYYYVECRDVGTKQVLAKTAITAFAAKSVTISNVSVSQTSDTSVRISFTRTSTALCSAVYDTQANIPEFIPTDGSAKIASAAQQQFIDVGGLSASITYYARIVCVDAVTFEKAAVSEIVSFSLVPSNSSPDAPDQPSFTDTSLTMGSLSSETGADYAIIRWTTSVPTNGEIRYGLSMTSLAWAAKSQSTLATSHEVTLKSLRPLTTYYYRITAITSDGRIELGPITAMKTIEDATDIDPGMRQEAPASDQVEIENRLESLGYRYSETEAKTVEREKTSALPYNQDLTRRLKGRILLQVEEKGEAWYVDPITEKKYYLSNGYAAHAVLRAFGLGITNADLMKIPVGVDGRFDSRDSDGDGLADTLEQALGTDYESGDSDGDGHDDKTELLNNYDPLGPGQLSLDGGLAARLEGRIVLQVQSRGEAWYVFEGRRYYLGSGEQTYAIMKFLSLGISNDDLRRIAIGEIQR